MPAASILPRELATMLEAGNCQLIDVREPVEHAESHISSATLIPQGQLDSRLSDLDRTRPVIVMCQGGRRGAAATEKLRSLGFSDVRNLEGGLLAWKNVGLPCVAGARTVMPLMRQVQVTMGLCVLIGSLLTAYADPRWVYLPMLFGAGLVFAGLSGFCGLAMLLSKMPWNKVNRSPGSKSSTSP